MNKAEYLLTCLTEECGEVIQSASKLLRFGTDEITKAKLQNEINDVYAIVELIDKFVVGLPDVGNREAISDKKSKVFHYMNKAEKKGIIN